MEVSSCVLIPYDNPLHPQELHNVRYKNVDICIGFVLGLIFLQCLLVVLGAGKPPISPKLPMMENFHLIQQSCNINSILQRSILINQILKLLGIPILFWIFCPSSSTKSTTQGSICPLGIWQNFGKRRPYQISMKSLTNQKVYCGIPFAP